MIRILHVVTHMNRGGLETMIMNYYRNINREEIQFDFLVHREYEADYDKEILESGGRIYRISRLIPWSRRYKRELKDFFLNHPEYSIVHVHQDCLSSVILKAARECEIPVRIVHAHSSSQDKDLKYPIKLYYKRKISEYATDFFACGQKAGTWMFGGHEFSILNNAVDVKKYEPSLTVREKVRRELGLTDEFLFGHVGRFCTPKNHAFLIDIFYEVLKKCSNARLILVGEGEKQAEIETKVRKLGIADKVIFTGIRTDVNELMQAMDFFLFPSLYEGLAIAVVEAQAAGIPCVISDGVPSESIVTTGLVSVMGLKVPAKRWAEHIVSRKLGARINHLEEIKKNGFEISDAVGKLEKYYLEKAKKLKILPEQAGKSDKTLTVFTPAYNRAHTLSRTYESLCKQSNKDFIWMIVDDGSADNTEELVKQWQLCDNGFEIQYIYKENGGMHTAHNIAYEHIVTELNVCIDSDDCMGEEAVDKIIKAWERVRDKGYAGIIGLDADMATGKIIGKGFPGEMQETTLCGYYAAGGSGDKKLVYRTDVIKATPPYPVFPGEKYVGLAYKYNIIDMKYKLYVLDEILCEVEYQAEGSSYNMLRQYLNNPRGFAFLRKFYMTHPQSAKRLIVDCIHYCSSSQISHNRSYIKESPRKALTVLCTPFGWLLTVYIKHGAAKLSHGWDQEKKG